ncbi:hypothetical protein KC131_15195 [Pseudomonas sp. JQ170]|uniref:hypothetical protein n=1 Tax=unclassified Pseudomonas TaxID=196821 RepID=UPI002650BA19|nr:MULTISPECIES: hypothetical protein [unclassified Pseudomonas]MDN7141992.1 hypothetical protein [Pseudomonas sp. JQ170]WRO78290.1 hypothetical protein U9R80_11660 [Pseudomonas sp. 170C]
MNEAQEHIGNTGLCPLAACHHPLASDSIWLSSGYWANAVKKVFGWVLGTVLAVPITKWVEGELNLSFFSPAISGLWGWLKGIANWFARDVSLPFWLLMLMIVLMVALAVPVGLLIYARYEKGEAPAGAPLTDDQNLAFVIIGKAIQEGYEPGFDDVLRHSRLSRIATQNALEHLTAVGLIRPVSAPFGRRYAELTALGRKHFLELEASSKSDY